MKSPILVRAIIYMLLAALPVWATYFSGVIDSLKDHKYVLDHWTVWAYLAVTSVIQALLTLRAYIDGSAERARTTEPTEPPKP